MFKNYVVLSSVVTEDDRNEVNQELRLIIFKTTLQLPYISNNVIDSF